MQLFLFHSLPLWRSHPASMQNKSERGYNICKKTSLKYSSRQRGADSSLSALSICWWACSYLRVSMKFLNVKIQSAAVVWSGLLSITFVSLLTQHLTPCGLKQRSLIAVVHQCCYLKWKTSYKMTRQEVILFTQQPFNNLSLLLLSFDSCFPLFLLLFYFRFFLFLWICHFWVFILCPVIFVCWSNNSSICLILLIIYPCSYWITNS